MKSKPLYALGSVLLIATAVAGLVIWGARRARTVDNQVASGETETATAAPSSNPRQIVRIGDEQLRQFGVVTAVAGPGRLRTEITLPGEVAVNADRVAHVVPRVPGVVREVRKNLGDVVHRGEVMAVLESRDLADATASLLAARERLSLAENNFSREERLWTRRISPEQDYFQAKNSLAEAGIAVRLAEQKLRVLGFSEEYIARLPNARERSVMIYNIEAPFDATVTEKHISLGEVLKEDSAAFVIADLSSVWVNLDVHQKDLPFIRVGQRAVVSIGSAMPEVEGRVGFLEPVATETNRTIHARVVIANREGRYRPGLFVSGRVFVEDADVPVVVPNDAILLVDGRPSLFIRESVGFRLQAITRGRSDRISTEVTEGLSPGQTFVSKGSFTLKSELDKPAPED
jgi:membrane fusion protein, heavy metal efflux system